MTSDVLGQKKKSLKIDLLAKVETSRVLCWDQEENAFGEWRALPVRLVVSRDRGPLPRSQNRIYFSLCPRCLWSTGLVRREGPGPMVL